MEITRVLLVVMAVCLAISLFFNGYLYHELTRPTEHQSPMSFSFVFDSTMQKLVNGTLHLNLTFDVVEGNLTVKAEINAESYNEYATLALQFDSDNNGTIDVPEGPPEGKGYEYDCDEDDLQFLLRANNNTRPSWTPYWGWYSNGTIWCFSKIWVRTELPSTFHHCYYNVTKGCYTFYFTFPIEPKEIELWGPYWGTIGGVYGIQGKLVRVLYGIVPFDGRPAKDMAVYVPPFKFME